MFRTGRSNGRGNVRAYLSVQLAYQPDRLELKFIKTKWLESLCASYCQIVELKVQRKGGNKLIPLLTRLFTVRYFSVRSSGQSTYPYRGGRLGFKCTESSSSTPRQKPCGLYKASFLFQSLPQSVFIRLTKVLALGCFHQ